MKKVLFLSLCLFALSAQADILTFDAQPEVYFETPILEGDYIFSSDYDGFGTNNNSLWPSNGTIHLMSWTNSGDTSGFSLTSATSSVFDVNAFDFAGGYLNGDDPVNSLSVTGWLDGILVNSTTFAANVDYLNSSTYTTLNLNDFTGIDLLQVTAIGDRNRANFDNFVLNASSVPEPVSLGLLSLGLIGLGLARKQKTA